MMKQAIYLKKFSKLIPLLLLALLSACLPLEEVPRDLTPVRVERVVDGDTFVAQGPEGKIRVRMIGVDTPESVKPNTPVEYYALEASAFTKEQLTGKKVYLETDEEERDHYQRVLAYVWLDKARDEDEDLYNYLIVAEGYARSRPYPPNTRHQKLLDEAQDLARKERAGMWSATEEEDSAEPVAIKGNRRSHIYHLPEDPSYNSISPKNVIWFHSIEEAEAAGYRRAGNK
ncbi:MAG: thermonuclease family protein [Tissierellia bacterium]|nr:thermonuclease family protein [Tissierellia bacterium]